MMMVDGGGHGVMEGMTIEMALYRFSARQKQQTQSD